MVQQPCILVLDDERTTLGSLSLELVRGEARVFYANDLDELALLSRERGDRGVVVLAPNDVALELGGVSEKRLGIAASGIVPAGSRPPEKVVEMLRTAGIRWHLWACGNAEEARHVVNAAVWDLDPAEIRFDARVPCKVGGSIGHGSERESVVVVDVGPGGICTLWPRAPQTDARVQVTFSLSGLVVGQDARVAWVREDQEGRWRAGLSFCDPGQRTVQLLRSEVSRWMQLHRLEP
jgi:hypothetical protein